MMNNFLPKLAVATAGVALSFAVLEAKPASAAATFTFFLDGFTAGGTLSGTFTGTDINGNGIIRKGLVTNEFDFYEAIWSGNSIVPPFTHRLGDQGFQPTLIDYRLLEGSLFLESVVGSLDNFTEIDIASGPPYTNPDFSGFVGIGTSNDFVFDITFNPARVTPIDAQPVPAPEPSVGISLLSLGFLVRKKIASSMRKKVASSRTA